MRRRTVAVVAGAALVAGTALLIVTRPWTPRGASAAVRILEDQSAFETPARAADAFARVAEILHEAGASCGTSPECADLLSASAVAEVFAFQMLRCTPARADEARRGLLDYVRAISSRRSARPPPIPTC